MRIIGYHCWNGVIADSDGDYKTEPPYLDFLLNKKDAIRIFYYLAQDISALCKATNMNEIEVRNLFESSQKKIYMPPYKMRYVKDRFLNLQKGFYNNAPYAYFYDAHQYKDVQAEDDNTPEKCVGKAKVAQQIGQEIYQAFNELGIHSERLISPVRVYEDNVLNQMDLPNEDAIPENAGLFAYQGCLGNWLEAFQIGHWDMVWDYDLNSAYPSFIAQQMDLRKGKWVESIDYVEGARYAECYGDIKVNSSFSPIMFRAGERNSLPLNYTATGNRKTYFSKRIIDYIKLYGVDEYKIDKGYWWIPNDDCGYPLKETINKLYLEKEKSSGIKKEIVKRIMSGIYGKMLEMRESNDLINPVWAEDIETGTRIEVAEFAMRNKLDVIHVAVDGVVSATPATLGEEGFGKWRLANVSKCICTGTGNVALNNNGHGDFSLTYDKVKELIENNPDAKEYKLSKMNPVTIAEALNGKWDKLGTLQEINKYIGIGQDEKRCYKVRPKNGGELLKGQFRSEPWDISLIENLKEI